MADLSTVPTSNSLTGIISLLPQLLGQKTSGSQTTTSNANIQALLDLINNFSPANVTSRTQAGVDYQTNRLLQGPLLNFIGAQNASGGYGGVNPYLSQIITDAAGQGAALSNQAVTQGGQIQAQAAGAVANATKTTSTTDSQTKGIPGFNLGNLVLATGLGMGIKKIGSSLWDTVTGSENSGSSAGTLSGSTSSSGTTSSPLSNFFSPLSDAFSSATAGPMASLQALTLSTVPSDAALGELGINTDLPEQGATAAGSSGSAAGGAAISDIPGLVKSITPAQAQDYGLVANDISTASGQAATDASLNGVSAGTSAAGTGAGAALQGIDAAAPGFDLGATDLGIGQATGGSTAATGGSNFLSGLEYAGPAAIAATAVGILADDWLNPGISGAQERSNREAKYGKTVSDKFYQDQASWSDTISKQNAASGFDVSGASPESPITTPSTAWNTAADGSFDAAAATAAYQAMVGNRDQPAIGY